MKVTLGASTSNPMVGVCVQSAVKVTEDGGICSDRKTTPGTEMVFRQTLCSGLCSRDVCWKATFGCYLSLGKCFEVKNLGNICLASRLCCITGCCKIEGREKWGELSWIREKVTRCTCQTVTKPAVKVEDVQQVSQTNFSAAPEHCTECVESGGNFHASMTKGCLKELNSYTDKLKLMWLET